MRTLNVKLAVVLLVVVIVVAGSTHLLHSYQLQRNSTIVQDPGGSRLERPLPGALRTPSHR